MVGLKKQGKLLFGQGDFDGAVKRYSKAIEKGPKWDILLLRAKAYFELKNYEWVQIDCDTCLNFNPRCLQALLLKAKVHCIEGKKDLAVNCYKKCLEIDSNCSEATEGYKNCAVQTNSDPKAGLEDPEVQKILKNPTFAKRSPSHPRTRFQH